MYVRNTAKILETEILIGMYYKTRSYIEVNTFYRIFCLNLLNSFKSIFSSIVSFEQWNTADEDMPQNTPSKQDL